jgi:hypothetical protein
MTAWLMSECPLACRRQLYMADTSPTHIICILLRPRSHCVEHILQLQPYACRTSAQNQKPGTVLHTLASEVWSETHGDIGLSMSDASAMPEYARWAIALRASSLRQYGSLSPSPSVHVLAIDCAPARTICALSGQSLPTCLHYQLLIVHPALTDMSIITSQRLASLPVIVTNLGAPP